MPVLTIIITTGLNKTRRLLRSIDNTRIIMFEISNELTKLQLEVLRIITEYDSKITKLQDELKQVNNERKVLKERFDILFRNYKLVSDNAAKHFEYLNEALVHEQYDKLLTIEKQISDEQSVNSITTCEPSTSYPCSRSSSSEVIDEWKPNKNDIIQKLNKKFKIHKNKTKTTKEKQNKNTIKEIRQKEAYMIKNQRGVLKYDEQS